MLDRDAESEPNPYAAPKVFDSPPIDENDWAGRLRAEFAKEEKSVKHLSWLNFLLAMLCVPYALIGLSALIVATFFRRHYPNPSHLIPLIFLGAGCGLAIVLNLWIWYALRRFSRWAWKTNLGLAVLGLALAGGALAFLLGLEAPFGSPIVVSLLIALPSCLTLRVLAAKRVCRLFHSDYQQALQESRRVR
jgi:hypothetical protein